MATLKKGMLVKPPEQWKHFRAYLKRFFWHRHRKAERREIEKQRSEA